jgi:hypothetical protein
MTMLQTQFHMLALYGLLLAGTEQTVKYILYFTFFSLLLSPVSATRPAHLILVYLITRTIFGEEYKT